MLYVEVILPFCAFFTGPPRFVGAWGLIVLMLGIFLTGNWGQFNLGFLPDGDGRDGWGMCFSFLVIFVW